MKNIIKSPIISLNAYELKESAGKTAEVKGRPFYSLTYRKQGKVMNTTAEKTFVSTPGSITFMPKNQIYRANIMVDTHLIAIHFDCLDNTEPGEPFVLDGSDGHLAHLFELVYKTFSTDGNNIHECYSHFYHLLAEIGKLFKKEEESLILPAVIDAKAKIEKNFSDNNFNIDSLVSELKISPSYLRSEFKRAYSVTPIEYLKYIRHQNALSLLASDYYSIEDLAQKCGYGSASYFIQSFHKSTGYSPLKYKEKFLDH